MTVVADRRGGRKLRVALLGISGRPYGFLLSLYNLKAYALTDPQIRRDCEFVVVQEPYRVLPEDEAHVTRVAERVIALEPDVLAVSCYMWNTATSEHVARLVKAALPGVRVVWGGPEISRDYVQAGVYDRLPIDFCVSGEGELTFLELLLHVLNGEPPVAKIDGLSYRESVGGPLVVNRPRRAFPSLEDVPSPFLSGVVDDETICRPEMQANIETQRGCNLRCSYCVYHKDMSRISYSDADRALAEITYVVNKGIRNIRIVDANFGSDLDHAKRIMRGIITGNFETKLTFELIPGFIDEELASLFADFNSLYDWNDVRLGVGVQSVNLDTLRTMRRAIRIEKFERTFELLRTYDIFAKVDIIIGLPGEDADAIGRTLGFMIERLRDSRRHLLCCHVMRGLPGTELLEIARRHEMVFSSPYDDREQSLNHDAHELLYSPALPRADMVHTLRRTAVTFWITNSITWIADKRSAPRNPRDEVKKLFFRTAAGLELSPIELVDRLVEGLVEELGRSGSRFADPEFPRPESWWWQNATDEIRVDWVIDFLRRLTRPARTRETALV